MQDGFDYQVLLWFGQYPPFSLLGFLTTSQHIPRVWQFLTYAFIHFDVWHLLFNMIVLWFFGPALESDHWGTRYFWIFYLGTAIGAGVFHAVVSLAVPGLREMGPVIGASGAITALMLAMAAYRPNVTVLLYFVIPIQLKYLVAIAIGFDILYLGSGDNISRLTHLGGIVIGYLMLARKHKDFDLRTWRWR